MPLHPAERANRGDAVGARVRARILRERDALAAIQNLQRYSVQRPTAECASPNPAAPPIRVRRRYWLLWRRARSSATPPRARADGLRSTTTGRHASGAAARARAVSWPVSASSASSRSPSP